MTLDAESPLEEAFRAARDLPAEEREEFIAGLMSSDAVLAAELEQMLGLLAEAERGLPESWESSPPESSPTELTASAIRVEGFEIEAPIGSGSFGLVFRARQLEPARVVALKVLRTTLNDDAVVRFKRESDLLARLAHPGIAAVFAAGPCHTATGETLSYIAMEFVSGARTIVDWARQEHRTLRQRVELVIALCEAVHHGHQREVIHRDIKPANVLVSDSGELKVIDFGIARALDVEMSVELTTPGVVVGTIAYMSPEQAKAGKDSIDIRTDIYAVGVLLFELIAGEPPHDLDAQSLLECLMTISTRPVPRLSSRVAGLSRDLDAIVAKATAFEAPRRYESLFQMACDLRAFLSGDTVSARLPTPAYVLKRTLARHKIIVAAIAIVLVTSIAATLVSWSLYLRAENRGILAEERSKELQWQVYVTNLAVAQEAIRDGELKIAMERLESCPSEFRHWEWRHLRAACSKTTKVLRAYERRVGSLAFLANTRLVSSGPADRLTLWDLESQTPTRYFLGVSLLVDTFQVHQGRRLIAAVDRAGQFVVWDFSGELLFHQEIMSGSYAESLAFSPDATRCYISGRGATSKWENGSVSPFSTRQFRSIHVAQDSKRVFAIDYRGKFFVLGNDGHVDEEFAAHTGRASFVPSVNRRTVSLGQDGWLRIWNSEAEQQFALKLGESLRAGAWSPDGSMLALVARRSVILLETQGWREIGRASLRGELPLSLAFSPDGERLVVGCDDGNIELLIVESILRRAEIVHHGGTVFGLVLSSDGKRLASCDEFGVVAIWDVGRGLRLRHSTRPASSEIRDMAFDPSANRLALASVAGELCVLDADTGTVESLKRVEIGAVSASYDRNLASVIVGDWKGHVAQYGLADGVLQARFPEHRGGVRSLIRTRGGRQMLSTDYAGRLRLFDVRRAKIMRELATIPSPVTCAAFDPAEKLLAVGAQDYQVRLIDTEDGSVVKTLVGHRHGVLAAVFTSDGRRLLTTGFDGTLRVWDPQRGDLLLTLRSVEDPVYSIAYRPSDGLVITGHASGVLRLWPSASQ